MKKLQTMYKENETPVTSQYRKSASQDSNNRRLKPVNWRSRSETPDTRHQRRPTWGGGINNSDPGPSWSERTSILERNFHSSNMKVGFNLEISRDIWCDCIPELTEETGQDPIVEGVTFYVRYLGSCFVINKAGDEATSEAIKSIVSMVTQEKECKILNNIWKFWKNK